MGARAVAPALLGLEAKTKIRLLPFWGKAGAVILPLLLLLLADDPSGSAADELRFGVEVARKGLWQEARFRFERAVLLDPENHSALNNLAIALEQQGEFDKAREAYERALKLKPNSLYIQQNYDLFREADDKRNRKQKRKP
jgi:tetratricopeptide (TPR) repeat protein